MMEETAVRSMASSRTKWCSTCSLDPDDFVQDAYLPWDVLNIDSRVVGHRFSEGDRGGIVRLMFNYRVF